MAEYRDSPGVAEYRDSPGVAEYRDRPGRAAKLAPGRAVGLLLKLVPGLEAGPRTGTRSGTSCRRVVGLVAGHEELLKSNSRVKIGQRRRVQHLEKFRLFRCR